MSEAVLPRERCIVIRMEGLGPLLPEALKTVATLAGGALGLEWYKRWTGRRQATRQQPIELTAKILDDGDELRRELMAEVRRLSEERDKAVERAHAAEMRLASLEPDYERLKIRLERKDERCKALEAQVAGGGTNAP
ncbi:MAG TPA: hypothetical protein VF017_15575 [Thermoanaerobaculia bacterium]|nr:hypothetical protein [Thermoanaerobaculia bacterium]